jgi:murein DD-endopeptidase MepM/ murein hydrolase activator NlpD
MPGVLGAVTALVSGAAIALATVSTVTSPAEPRSPTGLSVADVVSGGVLGAVPTRPGQAAAPDGVTLAWSRFRWPLDPRPGVLRRFAVGPAPWSPGHRGVDLAASPRQPVLAAGAGVVSFAGRIAGVGAVSVAHGDGLRTTYQPVDAEVHVGDRVTTGQELGTVSSWTGHCARPCLHWGAIRGAAYIDPLTLLGLVPPVLLPLLG